MEPVRILEFYRTDSPKVWIIGSRARRVTLYSQQVRALNLVHSLAGCGRIGPGSRVVIIGGGAAGLTAAIAAAYHVGSEVTLIETGSGLMPLQRGSVTRWLHPHLWDWPREDATVEDAGLPVLNWTAGTADKVAAEICDAFEHRNRDERRVDVRLDARNVTFSPPCKISWHDRERGHQIDRSADAVLFAVGFGIEPREQKFGEIAVPASSYWAMDQLEQNLTRRPLRYLVSGTGDGGLIDTLRLRLTNFRHQYLVRTFFESDEDDVIPKLLQIEDAAHARPESLRAEFLYDAYQELQTPRVNSRLSKHQRADTNVTLHGNGEYWITLNTSVLNRFLVSRLLAMPGASEVSGLTYRHGELTIRRNSGIGYEATIKGGDPESFDGVVFRHGPRSEVSRFFSEPELARLNALRDVDPTNRPLYGDRFGRAPASPRRAERHKRWHEQLAIGIKAASLSWPVFDDAIEIPVRVDAAFFDANVAPYAYARSLDVLTRNDAYSEDVHKARAERWTQGYEAPAATFLRDNLADYSRGATARKDECKVGVARFDFTVAADPENGRFLTLRPVNHLVTELFNRRLALDRIDERDEAERLWQTCFTGITSGNHIHEMPCPSQLFLELSVSTSDGAVVIARKSSTNSVYARRNGGYVRTCGVEGGPNWEQVIVPGEGPRVRLAFDGFALKLLRAEYQVACGDSPPPSDVQLLPCGIPRIQMHSFALQGVHLNMAILGHCVLPVPRRELEAHLRAIGSAGGLVFDHELQFWGQDECRAALVSHTCTAQWHGTALLRLKYLVANWSRLVAPAGPAGSEYRDTSVHVSPSL